MIGRQVIVINKTFTLQELEQFMQENWDKEQYNDFSQTVSREGAVCFL